MLNNTLMKAEVMTNLDFKIAVMDNYNCNFA